MKYRRPYGTDWESLDLDTAMDMIADRVVDDPPDAGRTDDNGRRPLARMGIASPRRGHARQRGELPHQEAVHRARARSRSRTRRGFDTASTVPSLGTSFGRGGATTFQQDLAEQRLHRDPGLQHGRVPSGRVPVGDGGQARGATLIHVDPRFTRTMRSPTSTSRSGPVATSPSSVALINHVLQNDCDSTTTSSTTPTAPPWSSDDYEDTEDLDGLFSGFDADGTARYDDRVVAYDGMEVQSGRRAPRRRSTRHFASGSEPPGDRARRGEIARSGGAPLGEHAPTRRRRSKHPRCVFQC